jgi:hypothetical protein
MNTTPPPSIPVQTQRCGLAVWSLVLGILALTLSVACIGPIFGIPAVICGHMALGRIRRAAGMLTGQGLATGGLITGYISLALIPIIALLAAIAIPNFVKARQTAQMNACINNLRLIDSAKQQWALETQKDESALPTTDNLQQYLGRDASAPWPICPAGGNYQIKTVGESPTCDIPNHALP